MKKKKLTLANLEDLSLTKLSLFFIVKKYGYVAVHEAAKYLRKNKIYCNENAVASRLWQMSSVGILNSRYRKWKRYKEWFIKEVKSYV